MRARASSLSLAALLAVAALAPLLANDRPLVARVAGALRFPAFASYLGDRGPAPGAVPWKIWWRQLGEDSGDWAVMPPWPNGPGEVDPDAINRGPSRAHPLGNDDTGRDVLARLVHGATNALVIGIGAVALALLIGVPLGALAGYRGGWVDHAVSRLIEIFLCFPALFLVLAAAAMFGGSPLGVIVVLGSVYWTAFARVVRGEFLSLREREFVLAARGLGVRGARLVVGHLLPCSKGLIAVTAAFLVANAIVVESTLSFLGVGGGAGTVSWGAMLAQGRLHAAQGHWHLWLFPALALTVAICSLHGCAERWRSGAIPSGVGQRGAGQDLAG
jgi:peptide/nickel transport system permease protein